MPIKQERMIALIDILDEALASLVRLRQTIQAVREDALAKFYAANGNENPLASTMLSHIQAIEASTSDPLLSAESITTLAQEREHFRALRGHNARSARAMRNKRRRASLDQSYITKEL